MARGHSIIAEQSRTWLREAFLAVLKEKQYAELTVTDIVDRAKLSRRTFYRHFASKDALLTWYLAELFAAYEQRLTAACIMQHQDTLLLFFYFWHSHREELLLLHKRGLFAQLIRQANCWFPLAYNKLKVPWHIAGSVRAIHYAAAFGAGGYFNMLMQWMQGGCRESPQEMVHIVNCILQALGREDKCDCNDL